MTDEVWQSFAAATWTDLAANLPGQAVRRQADELYAQWRAKPLLPRLLTPRTAERRWRRGAEGEEVVARRLTALDPTWRVLHTVPLGDRTTEIDHVVIGAGGVFTVHAHNHPGKKIWSCGDIVMVNGFRHPHVRHARHDADLASRLLSASVGFDVPVKALVVVVGTVKATVKEQPRDGAVVVSTPRAGRRWIQRHAPVLSPEAVERIYAMARRSSTWTMSADDHGTDDRAAH